MRKKILAFGASNSRNSINKTLANYTAAQVKDAQVDLIDLNDYEMPIYSIDRQNELGIPDLAHQFLAKVKEADGIVISLAEHNGSYSVAFKNVFDWVSRIEKNVWMNKPMFLLASSPGQGGGKMVLEIAFKKFSYMSSNKVFQFSLPAYANNFHPEQGILNAEIAAAYRKQLADFEDSLSL